MTFLSAFLGAFLGAFCYGVFSRWRANKAMMKSIKEMEDNAKFHLSAQGFDRLAHDLMKDEERRH